MGIPVPRSMSLTVHLFLVESALVLLLLCPTTSCLRDQFNRCLSDTVTCEDVEFSYPFGINGSGCGDREFQLESCDDQGHALINIGGNHYHILGSSLLFFLNGTIDPLLRIVDDNLWGGGKCDLSGNYSQFWSPASHFQILDTYTNLTLWKKQCDDKIPDNIHGLPAHKLSKFCDDEWQYSLNPHIDLERTPFCNAFQVPVNKYLSDQLSDPHFINVQTLLEQGFDVSWQVDPNRFRSCDPCFNSNGYCGYDISKPTTFLCYCPDGTSHPEKCFNIAAAGTQDTGTQDTGTRKMSAIVVGCYVLGIGMPAITIIVVLFFTYDACKRRSPSPRLTRMGSVQMSVGNGNDAVINPSHSSSAPPESSLFTSAEKSSSVEIIF